MDKPIENLCDRHIDRICEGRDIDPAIKSLMHDMFMQGAVAVSMYIDLMGDVGRLMVKLEMDTYVAENTVKDTRHVN